MRERERVEREGEKRGPCSPTRWPPPLQTAERPLVHRHDEAEKGERSIGQEGTHGAEVAVEARVAVARVELMRCHQGATESQLDLHGRHEERKASLCVCVSTLWRPSQARDAMGARECGSAAASGLQSGGKCWLVPSEMTLCLPRCSKKGRGEGWILCRSCAAVAVGKRTRAEQREAVGGYRPARRRSQRRGRG